MIEETEDTELQKQSALKELAQEIESKFNMDCSKRSRKEQEWIESERLVLGSMYKFLDRWSGGTPFSKEEDKNDHPEHNIVKPKLKIAKAALEMLQFGAGTDKNFHIKPKQLAEDLKNLLNQEQAVFGGQPHVDEQGQPVSIADLAQQKIQEDAESARKMDEEVFAQLLSSNYGKKVRDGFDSNLGYGTTVYHGPVNSVKCNKKKTQLQTSSGQTIWTSVYEEIPRPDFELLSVWQFYPDYRALCIEECEHATVVHVLSPKQFRQLHKRPGFIKDKIVEISKDEPVDNYYSAFKSSAARYNNDDYLNNKYVCLQWHGTVTKDQCGCMGIDPPFDNPFDLYRAEIWVCQGEIINASLEMLESDDELPFAVDVWEKDPSSLFGFGAILLRDPQRVVNKSYQAMLDNAGLAALPMWAWNEEMIDPIDGKPEIGPGKGFKMTTFGQDPSKAIAFFYVPANTEHLKNVLMTAKEFGNEESTIPLIAGGMQDPTMTDAGATGMAMVMQASTSLLSSKARQHDDNITKKIVTWFYEWNMQYSEKEEIKCDCEIDVQTSTAYLQKVLGQRDLERLCIEYAQNPELKFLLDGNELYRARLAGMNIPYDRIVYDNSKSEQLRQQAAEAQAQQPNPDQMKAESSLMTAQAKMKQVELEEQRLAFDADEGMKMAEMAHQEKMEQYRIREEEAETRHQESIDKKQVELLKIDQKDAHLEATLNQKRYVADSKHSTDKFMKGIDATQKAQQIRIEAENAKTKRQVANKPKPQGSK